MKFTKIKHISQLVWCLWLGEFSWTNGMHCTCHSSEFAYKKLRGFSPACPAWHLVPSSNSRPGSLGSLNPPPKTPAHFRCFALGPDFQRTTTRLILIQEQSLYCKLSRILPSERRGSSSKDNSNSSNRSRTEEILSSVGKGFYRGERLESIM